MSCRRAGLAVVSILLLAASSARADSTIHVDEAAGFSGFPSFPGSASGALSLGSVGTLGIGANTVTGSVSGTSMGSDSSSDYFYLALPSGLAITSADIHITNLVHGAGAIPGPGAIDDHGTLVLISDSVTYPLSPYDTSGDFLVRVDSAESYTVTLGATLPITSFAGGFNYVITYNVEALDDPSAAPLPGTFGLGAVVLPLAIAGMALHRRRAQIA